MSFGLAFAHCPADNRYHICASRRAVQRKVRPAGRRRIARCRLRDKLAVEAEMLRAGALKSKVGMSFGPIIGRGQGLPDAQR
jgi:hypothetical protein